MGKRLGRGGFVASGALLALMLLAWGQQAFALNPSLDVSQYAHSAWKIRDGFFKGTIVAIAQTSDGYLWLGSEFGLLRFDGVRFVTLAGRRRSPAGVLQQSSARRLPLPCERL
jgi:ligand-binding sensor domain-containing protein